MIACKPLCVDAPNVPCLSSLLAMLKQRFLEPQTSRKIQELSRRRMELSY